MKVLLCLLGVAGFVVLLWGLTANSIMMKKYFGVWSEDVNREVFESTKSYNEGKLQQLAKYRQEYLDASPEGQKALQETIRVMFADYKEKELPVGLREFLRDMRGY